MRLGIMNRPLYQLGPGTVATFADSCWIWQGSHHKPFLAGVLGAWINVAQKGQKNKQPICNYALIPVEKENTPGPWLTCFGEFIILWKMSGILFCKHSVGTKQGFDISAIGATELFLTICWGNEMRKRNAPQRSYTCWPLGAPSHSCFSWLFQNPLQWRQNSWRV